MEVVGAATAVVEEADTAEGEVDTVRTAVVTAVVVVVVEDTVAEDMEERPDDDSSPY